MTRIWNKEVASGSRVLRLATLNNLGGAAKIVRTHLDTVMKRLKYPQRLLASQIFRHLVTPSGTKIAFKAGDLASYTKSSQQKVQRLLQRLTEQDIRLLRAIQTMDVSELSYEIFHDVLAFPILDWRARFQRSRAILLLSMLLFLLLVIFLLDFIYPGLTIIDLSSGVPVNASVLDFLLWLLRCLSGFFCLFCTWLIPLIIAFFIGRLWTRNK